MEQSIRQRPLQGERLSLGKTVSFQKKISGRGLSGKPSAGNVAGSEEMCLVVEWGSMWHVNALQGFKIILKFLGQDSH